MKILFFANSDWFLYNFNRDLATRLRDSGHEVILLSPPGPYQNKLLDLGFYWIPAPMNRRSINFFSEIIFLFWLFRFLKRERFDLVHSFTIKCSVYGSLIARFIGIKSRVNVIAGMGYFFTNSNLFIILLRKFLLALMKLSLGGRCSRLIVLNHDDWIFFKQSRIIDPKFIRVVPGAGVDCKRFIPSKKYIKNHKFRVLLPARILWDKGVAEFIDAARMLHSKGREIEFLLAGTYDPGNPSSVPLSVINGWVSEGAIRWLGHIDDMVPVYHEVDVVVLPSYREGLPTCLIEAAACALPLIASDVPGCRDVIHNEVDGLLIPVKSSLALANAVTRLHDDPSLCKKLGNAARNAALEKFEESVVNKLIINIYKELRS